MLEAAGRRIGRRPGVDRHSGGARLARRPALVPACPNLAVRNRSLSGLGGAAGDGRSLPVIVGGQAGSPTRPRMRHRSAPSPGFSPNATRRRTGGIVRRRSRPDAERSDAQVEREEAWTLGVTAARQRPIPVPAVAQDPCGANPSLSPQSRGGFRRRASAALRLPPRSESDLAAVVHAGAGGGRSRPVSAAVAADGGAGRPCRRRRRDPRRSRLVSRKRSRPAVRRSPRARR